MGEGHRKWTQRMGSPSSADSWIAAAQDAHAGSPRLPSHRRQAPMPLPGEHDDQASSERFAPALEEGETREGWLR